MESTLAPQSDAPAAQRLYVCKCGNAIFFRNSLCIACRAPLGYDPESGVLLPLRPAVTSGLWEADVEQWRPRQYLRCENLDSPVGCNWLIPVDEKNQPTLCVACRLNRTIPDLSVPGNAEKWRRIEVGKRRLVSSLLRLKLPVLSRVTEDPQGVAFDFLSSPPEGPAVLTGHEDGIITVNIDEAEDARREEIREQMNEQYRTILGHLRHEAGHYYWDRIIAAGDRLEQFRALFGDDRQDYDAALRRHHASGPPAGWSSSFVSAYATAHPWEDWAETWAHYLHMIDTVDTASSFNLMLGRPEVSSDAFDASVLCQPQGDEPNFLSLINGWVQLTPALNELSLSMGLHDFYPFVLSGPVVTKLHFVHVAIHTGHR